VFYHGATCTEDVRGGLVLERAPQLGPVVVQGPASTHNNKRCALFRGGGWKNAVFSAFPVTTGPSVPRAEELVPVAVLLGPASFGAA
jgi:hypothetical protein